MTREIEPCDRNGEWLGPEPNPERGSRAPREIPEEMREPARRADTFDRERQSLVGRTYAYHLSPAELETLYDVGRFRTLAVQDLARQRYPGKAGDLRQDLRSLLAQGLQERRSLWTRAGRRKLTLLVLTKRGKELVQRAGKPALGQKIYAGFVKPAQLAHDAAIYRMFQIEARDIERRGGQIRRVILDYELKQNVYTPLAKARTLPAADYARRQAEVARANGLSVVQGKIPLPDLRIEYRTKIGEMTHVDLELATHHYHGSHLAMKAQAGFKMYAPDGSAGALRAALDEREITAEILSL